MTDRIIRYFLSQMPVSVFVVLASLQIILVPVIGLSMEGPVSSVLIRPGYGVADLQLDDPVPPDKSKRDMWLEKWKHRNIHIDLDQNHTRINQIIIRSPKFFIDGNRIAVYRSSIREVEKFYGHGNELGKTKRSYPLFGVSFSYDPVSKKVIEIIIFRPEKKELKLNPKAIKTIMEQMKHKEKK